MSGGGAESGAAPIQAVVGTARSGYSGDKSEACRRRGGGGIRGRGREREIRVGKNGGRGLICLGEPETI